MNEYTKSQVMNGILKIYPVLLNDAFQNNPHVLYEMVTLQTFDHNLEGDEEYFNFYNTLSGTVENSRCGRESTQGECSLTLDSFKLIKKYREENLDKWNRLR